MCGDDFCVIASDTRLAQGYSILSRKTSKSRVLYVSAGRSPPAPAPPRSLVGRRSGAPVFHCPRSNRPVPACCVGCRTDKCVIATGGCFTDISTLHKTLDTRIKMYAIVDFRVQRLCPGALHTATHSRRRPSQLCSLSGRMCRYKHDHGSTMTSTAIAQMLSTTLYGRRFFPFYAFNIVGGLDKDGATRCCRRPARSAHSHPARRFICVCVFLRCARAGKGAVFTYDAVGSYERVRSAAQGAAQKLMIPLLDNLVRAVAVLLRPRPPRDAAAGLTHQARGRWSARTARTRAPRRRARRLLTPSRRRSSLPARCVALHRFASIRGW